MERSETWALNERAKELECMYAVDEILQNRRMTLAEAMAALPSSIARGFSWPDACRVRIMLNGASYGPADYDKAECVCSAPITIDGLEVGRVEAGYIISQLEGQTCSLEDNEGKLLRSIAGNISRYALSSQRELSMLLDMLEKIDPDMLIRVCDKLRYHLESIGAGGAVDPLLQKMGLKEHMTYGEVNAPLPEAQAIDTRELTSRLIAIATSYLSSAETYSLFSEWIQQERVFSLVKTIDSHDTTIADILHALRKYVGAVPEPGRRSAQTETWLLVELAHRFLSSDEHLISLVLDTLKIADFIPLLERIIGSGNSYGHVGGKGAGLYIAKQILDSAAKSDELLSVIKTPRTWYIAADQLTAFLHYNHLEELNAYKYNSIFHLRMTYPGIVQRIKSAAMPPHSVQMLSLLLDDLGDTPIIVRSSSLLEDRTNAAFSGKYKSLFLANQGPKPERLRRLIDAVLEVYASMFNPDSIQYRKERELLNFTERMGIMIQEVIGKRMGRYFMPAYAGVAFSENVLRWSTRTTKEGGLVRMVMGLGTRAVDRVNDDYPALFSPGQPGLRVNQSPRDIKHYSQKHIDLIDLTDNTFRTVDAVAFLRECGSQVPGIGRMVSVFTPDQMQTKSSFDLDFGRDDAVITFEGLLSDTPMPRVIKHMLDALSKKMETPVDIEFASDGDAIYLLQCRPQQAGSTREPAPIPKDILPADLLFTASRFISNARLTGITHIVYVDPDGYSALSTRDALLDVGKAVGRLNELLPRRKYVLMGPGRWGSRGDIKLGVRVTYSDICHTAALIEMAKEKHAYVPELSFGTHFFQDLVEADIVYIPLYPDQKENTFRDRFFTGTANQLSELLPEYAHLSDTLRVIDVRKQAFGKTLSVHMNADLDQCVAFLTDAEPQRMTTPRPTPAQDADWAAPDGEQHWRWRQYMAEQLASDLDMESYGVFGLYLFGSTNTGATGMGSDIDLLVHFGGTDEQRLRLGEWLEGWSCALAKINFLRTGYMADGLLDAHIITDEDIRRGDSYAIKIHSIADPATPLRVRKRSAHGTPQADNEA